MLLATSAFAETSTWTGAVDGNWDTETLNWSNSGGNFFTDGDTVIFNDTLGANFGITLIDAVAPASILFADSGAGTNAYTFSGGGINGAGSLTLGSGFGGTVTLNAINGYTGGTIVNAGILNLSAGGWAGAINGVLTINAGGTVKGTVDDALGWGDAGARVTVVNVNGGIFESTSIGNQGRSQTWNLTGGTLRSNNGVAYGWANWDVGRIVFGPGTVVETFASATSSLMEGQFFLNPDDGHDNQTFTVADGAAVTDLLVTGNIATAYGTVGITKEGAGTMTLAANNSYNGTTVNAGTLILASGGWAGGIRGALTINAGATVRATVSDTLGYADTTWGVTVTQVNVNGGIFETTPTSSQGRNQTWNLTGGTLRSNNGVATDGFDWGVGSIVFGPGTVVETFASATSSLMEGQFLLNADDGHNNQTFTVADGAAATDLLVTGNIATTFGTVGITKAGAGTMALTSNSSYNGGTTVNAGTLILSAGGWAGTVRGVLTINAGATVKGTSIDAIGWGAPDFRVTVVNVNGGMFESTSDGNQGLSQTWNLTGGTVRSNNGVATNFLDYGAGRIVLDTTGVVQTFASADSSVFEGQIFLRGGDGHISQTFTVADGAAATDLLVSASIGNEWSAVGITKTGAGTMTVTGVNTYDGDTLVSAGTLVANNAGTTSATGTGNVTVNSGATLAGIGRIAPAGGKSVLVNGSL
ncbi:MAG: beta strand repeat-containing protein, partial [Roseimicrobium sp.]